MPCRSDYMEPTARERESKVVAKHIVVLHRLLKTAAPPDVAEAHSAAYGDVNLVDQHTALLCGMMNTAEIFDKVAEAIPLGDVDILEVMLWFRRHQEADKKREAREQAEALAERKRDLKELKRLLKKYPGYPEKQ